MDFGQHLSLLYRLALAQRRKLIKFEKSIHKSGSGSADQTALEALQSQIDRIKIREADGAQGMTDDGAHVLQAKFAEFDAAAQQHYRQFQQAVHELETVSQQVAQVSTGMCVCSARMSSVGMPVRVCRDTCGRSTYTRRVDEIAHAVRSGNTSTPLPQQRRRWTPAMKVSLPSRRFRFTSVSASEAHGP